MVKHRFVDREQEATESVLRSRSHEEPTMSLYPESPGSAAAERGPEMYQLDPLHEIRDQPRCEIGDLPPSDEVEPGPPTANAASSGYSAR